MGISLDVGTSRLRSLRRAGCELVGRAVPAAFALLDDEPATRSLLERAGLGYATGDGEIALIGETATQQAPVFQSAVLRLLPNGKIPTDDPPARQVLAALIESLLPSDPAPGEVCGLVLPVAAMVDPPSRDFLSHLISLQGFDPLVISAGHAIALANLSNDGYTGLSLSFGAGGMALSLVHRGRELCCVTDSRGCDSIDEEVAATLKQYAFDRHGMRRLDIEAARRLRERLSDSLTRPQSEPAKLVAELTTEILSNVVQTFAKRLAQRNLGPFPQPLPVIIAGGPTHAAGFLWLLQQELHSAGLTSLCGPIRFASGTEGAPGTEYLVARGALIHAELETAHRSAAA